MSTAPTAARRRRFRVAAALLPIACLLVAEAGLRLIGFRHDVLPPSYAFTNPEAAYGGSDDGVTMHDPELFWRLRPGWTTPSGAPLVADTGFRSAFEIHKASGIRRIVCLGDSSTFGLQVRLAAAWPAVTERRLRADGNPQFEVLNLGVPGYTSHQGRVLLERSVAALDPDDVVLAFGAFNDWVPARGRTDAEQGTTPLWAGLRVVQAVARACSLTDTTAAAPAGRLDDIDTRSLEGPRRVGPDDYAANLRTCIGWAQARGSGVVLVASPLPRATLERNPIATRYAAVAAEVARDAGVPFVDGWRTFAESGLTDAVLFADFCHPSARGHALLGAEVARCLSATGR